MSQGASNGKRIGAGKAGPGRKKGVPNKLTADIKAMVREALDRLGGVDYLVEQGRSNPTTFLGLVARLMPIEGGVTVKHVVEMAEEELERIAAGGSARIAGAPQGPAELDRVH